MKTKAEDEQLRLALQELGEKHWRVPARTPIQFLHRWTKTLKPGLVKGPWNQQEDEEMTAWVQLHGTNDWAGVRFRCSGAVPSSVESAESIRSIPTSKKLLVVARLTEVSSCLL